jgi:hypothetical protein
MSKSDKIEVSLSSAQELLEFLERKLPEIDCQMTSLQSDYDRTKATIAEIKAKLSGNAASITTNGSRKRLPKGHGEKIICDLLAAIPNGLPIQEIVTQAGVSYSSAFRILNKNKKGLFDNPNGVWILRQKK